MPKSVPSWAKVLSLAAVSGVVIGRSPVVKQSAFATRTTVPRTNSSQGSAISHPKHVVIVIEENHAYSELAGNPEAPYINRLMKIGANFTDYHAIEHPSEPNYLDIFSGSDQGVHDDSTPHTFSAPNLASELLKNHLTFGGYSESLPVTGYQGATDTAFLYARKHNPWVNFTNVPKSVNMPMTKFPNNFNELPTVSFVIPNVQDDMHDGSIAMGDAWLKRHLGRYQQWAMTHNSILIVTWDEDDQSESNTVPLVITGAGVRQGTYETRWNHLNLLRTLENMYRLSPVGGSRGMASMAGVWR